MGLDIKNTTERYLSFCCSSRQRAFLHFPVSLCSKILQVWPLHIFQHNLADFKPQYSFSIFMSLWVFTPGTILSSWCLHPSSISKVLLFHSRHRLAILLHVLFTLCKTFSQSFWSIYFLICSTYFCQYRHHWSVQKWRIPVSTLSIPTCHVCPNYY